MVQWRGRLVAATHAPTNQSDGPYETTSTARRRLVARLVSQIVWEKSYTRTVKPELQHLIQGTFLIGERKLVTILFADIAGSTALTERLGAEEALSALQPTLKAMMAAVRQYNGTVNKVQGDGIMAIFGAPITYEDHALRASLAAIDMQRRLDRINAGNPVEQGGAIKVRVGLHSGDVIVKSIRNDLSIDYDAVGPTVNLASRMEQSAEPGEIRLTEDTLKLIAPSLSAEAVGPVRRHGQDVSEPERRLPVGSAWIWPSC